MSKPTVCIVQQRLTSYRVPLFELMRELLTNEGIVLRLLHGEPDHSQLLKSDSGYIPWAERLPARHFANGRICWQPFGRQTRGSDLVIVTQENKLLYNLLALTLCRPSRIAFWGHGRNFQAARSDGWRERFKCLTTMQVDWWFTYTEATRGLVAGAGFPAERITNLDNAVDTKRLRTELAAVPEQAVIATMARHGLTRGYTGVYLGSLYPAKRIDFLLEAASRLGRLEPRFRLLVLGGGPDQHLVERLQGVAPWLRFMGPKRDEGRAALLRCADFALNPGMVGLSIVDMFAAGIPMVTTDCGLHSPEIAYLMPDVNGLMTSNSLEAYTDAVCSLMSDPLRLACLSSEARTAGGRYTIENMAARFASGIRACISHRPSRSVKPAAAERRPADVPEPGGIAGDVAGSPRLHPIMIVSVMRPKGETGVRTHMRAVLSAVAAGRRDDGADAWPTISVVSPFAAPCRIGLLLGARALIEPLSSSLAVRLYRAGHGRLLRSVLARRLAGGAPCIVYAQCPVSAAAALMTRSGPQQKVMMAVHFNVSQADEWAQAGRIPRGGRDFHAIRDFEARWLPQVDALVFVSRFMRGVLLEHLPGLAAVPHAIVPNFVAKPDAPAPGEAIGAVASDAFDADLISIGTLEPRKNQLAQLEIVAAARRAGTPLTLTIVGDGPDRAMLETRAAELCLANAVRFVGYVPDAARLIVRHRALLHTALIENLPIAPIEALAVGRPILAAPTGGTSELFDDGIEGLALSIADPSAAAALIIGLFADPARYAAMSRAACARHAARHTPAAVARRLVDFLERA